MTEWWKKAYPGGPMVVVKGLPRPLYPADAPSGYPQSEDGPDVEAYKRTISRAGRWEWQHFDRVYSNAFSHGKAGGNVGESGVAGVQRQGKIQATGWMGKGTLNLLRSIRIPEGLSHAGEPAMDARSVELINAAWDKFQGKETPPSNTRRKLSEHFVVEEFDCHDGTKCSSREYNGLESLCNIFLEPLHDKYGAVHINSGFRTPGYNASVGGASGSYHIYTDHDGNDQAVDITCANGTPSQWHSFLNNIRANKRGGNGGLGLYSTFVHVDMRDYPSSWTG
jgi:Peptidase M15